MIDTLPLIEKPAHEIPAGHAVFMRTGNGDVLCLKVQRKAKNYVQDYVVRLDPAADPEMALEFLDPEQPLADCGVPVQFTSLPGSSETKSAKNNSDHPRPGTLVESSLGLFLAVRETTKLHAFVSYVNVQTGMVRRLRQHTIVDIFEDWQFDVFGDPGQKAFETGPGPAISDR